MRHKLLIGVLVLGFSFSMLSLSVAQETATPDSAASTPVDSDDLRVFPDDLLCDRLEASSDSYGASWMGITIGKSSYNDLETLIEGFDLSYLSIVENEFEGRFVIEGSSANLDSSRTPFAISYCLENEIIQVLKISYSLNLKVKHPELSAFVNKLGKPDKITWTNNPNTRLVFWFSAGFAATIALPIDGEIGQTRVFQEIYFPYQETDDYEDRWPYNQTRKLNPYLVSPEDARVDFGTENPFDFDTIELTVTAQPTQTPTTPYMQPTATVTPTAD